MAPKRIPALALALASLAGLATAPSAGAVGLQGQRVAASSPEPPGGSLIATAGTCPGQGNLDAAAAAQEEAMRCMTDFARRQAGLDELAPAAVLQRSALEKSDDILRCDSFSHFACGREFAYWMRQSGYMSAPCWRVGENLAWGTGEDGTVRSIFLAWMRSPAHRANILGDYVETGISLRVGALEGDPGTRVWTEHFGSHCEGA